MEWEKIELELDVKDMLNSLPERLKELVIKRFFEFKVRRVISDEMGISISRVQQLESKALWKIRRNRKMSKSLKEYYLR